MLWMPPHYPVRNVKMSLAYIVCSGLGRLMSLTLFASEPVRVTSSNDVTADVTPNDVTAGESQIISREAADVVNNMTSTRGD